MATSQEIATRTSSQLPEQLVELEEILLQERPAPEAAEIDAAAASLEIIRQILGAQSEAEVEAFGATIGWRELARRYVRHDGLDVQDGLPVALVDYKWRPSEYEDGAPIYFVVQATRTDNGENVILTTGSLNVLAQLVAWDRLAREGKGTFRGRIVIASEAEKATKGGYWPLHLETPAEVKAALQGPSGDEEAAA